MVNPHSLYSDMWLSLLSFSIPERLTLLSCHVQAHHWCTLLRLCHCADDKCHILLSEVARVMWPGLNREQTLTHLGCADNNKHQFEQALIKYTVIEVLLQYDNCSLFLDMAVQLFLDFTSLLFCMVD